MTRHAQYRFNIWKILGFGIVLTVAGAAAAVFFFFRSPAERPFPAKLPGTPSPSAKNLSEPGLSAGRLDLDRLFREAGAHGTADPLLQTFPAGLREKNLRASFEPREVRGALGDGMSCVYRMTEDGRELLQYEHTGTGAFAGLAVGMSRADVRERFGIPPQSVGPFDFFPAGSGRDEEGVLAVYEGNGNSGVLRALAFGDMRFGTFGPTFLDLRLEARGVPGTLTGTRVNLRQDPTTKARVVKNLGGTESLLVFRSSPEHYDTRLLREISVTCLGKTYTLKKGTSVRVIGGDEGGQVPILFRKELTAYVDRDAVGTGPDATWHLVRTSSGDRGWVRGDFIAVVRP